MVGHNPRTVPRVQVALCTQAFGDPAGPAALLIMGATASMLWWPEGFCDALAATGLHVIRYDNRDTGQSTSGPPGKPAYSLDDMADDALAILDAYGADRAHLIGMSLGGMIAQLVALKAPDRVVSLTAISSSAFDDAQSEPISPQFMAHFDKLDGLDWKDRAAVVAYQAESARLSANDDARFDPAAAADLAGREFDRALDPRSAMNHGALSGGETWVGKVGEITVPALVIHGERDPILSLAGARRLADALPNAKLVILPGGHELHPDDWPAMIAGIGEVVGRASK